MRKQDDDNKRLICSKLCRLKAYTEQVNKIMQRSNDDKKITTYPK